MKTYEEWVKSLKEDFPYGVRKIQFEMLLSYPPIQRCNAYVDGKCVSTWTAPKPMFSVSVDDWR